MKTIFLVTKILALSIVSLQLCAQTNTTETSANAAGKKNLYIDVHHLGPGNVTLDAVAKAHAKDLATEGKYGVQFIKYWVDTAKGDIYCLSSSSDTGSIIKTHAEAHGLLPSEIYMVTSGQEAAMKGNDNLFLDVHYFGPGKVTAKDVAGAHAKDLAVEKKHGVNFINYWVDEKDGIVMCLSQAKDSTSIIQTHKEAHGLLPAYVLQVNQGQ